MKLNSKKLGQFIEVVDERNLENVSENLLGISIDKKFMRSVANTVGTDLTKYKLLKKGFFACNTMHVGRDKRLPVALYDSDQPAIISPAYCTFKVVDDNILNPEYLKLVFSSVAFDHECWFRTDGDIRGGLSWIDLCNIDLPVPAIEQQRKIVWMYQTIEKRIRLKEAINDNLWEQLSTLYLKMILQKKEKKQYPLKDFCFFKEGYVNPSQKHPEYFGEDIKWLRAVDINESFILNTSRGLTKEGFESAKKSAILFEPHTIAISKSGTIGRLGILSDFMCGNRAVINVIPKDKNSLPLIYLYLKSKQKELPDLAVGSVQKNLYISILENIEIELPSEEHLINFYRLSNSLIKCIEKNCIQSSELVVLKDSMLPKLISGNFTFVE